MRKTVDFIQATKQHQFGEITDQSYTQELKDTNKTIKKSDICIDKNRNEIFGTLKSIKTDKKTSIKTDEKIEPPFGSISFACWKNTNIKNSIFFNTKRVCKILVPSD